MGAGSVIAFIRGLGGFGAFSGSNNQGNNKIGNQGANTFGNQGVNTFRGTQGGYNNNQVSYGNNQN
jgi:hypothetical protein